MYCLGRRREDCELEIGGDLIVLKLGEVVCRGGMYGVGCEARSLNCGPGGCVKGSCCMSSM